MADLVLLKDMARDVARAKENLWYEIHQQFPVGSSVTWMYGHSQQNGTVTRHGYGGDFWARNDRSGREVRISLYKVLEASGV